MTGTELPLWAALPAALLLIAGGLLTLTAAIGRCGCPTSIRAFTLPMRATLGTGCVLLASMLVSSTLMQRPVAHELLITLFIVMTTPVTVICSCAPPYFVAARASVRLETPYENRTPGNRRNDSTILKAAQTPALVSSAARTAARQERPPSTAMAPSRYSGNAMRNPKR